MRIAIVACVIIMLSACVAQAPVVDAPLYVVQPSKINGVFYVDIPDADHLIFHGQLDDGSVAGTSGGAVYPAYDVISFLVAVAAHAVISDTVIRHKKNEAVKEADSILEPYQSLISQISPKVLLKESIISLHEPDETSYTFEASEQGPSENGWYTRTKPIYIMASSEDSISIINKIDIIESARASFSEKDDFVYSKLVYLKSFPLKDKSDWFKADGILFRDTMRDVFLASIQLAINDFSGLLPSRAELSTVRYLDNGNKKVERGRVIRKNCSHITFESLRNELKSMPRLSKSMDDSCF